MEKQEKYTPEELKWRYCALQSELTNYMEEIEEKDSPLYTSDHLDELMCSSLIICMWKDYASLVLHSKEKEGNVLFTASRSALKATAWKEPDEAAAFERPSDKIIPVPDPFSFEGNKGYSYVSLRFDFPNNKLGNLCEEYILELRKRCKDDTYVINLALFLKYEISEHAHYISIMRNTLFHAFIESPLSYDLQIPGEVTEIMELVLEDECQNLYDPFMRTGINFHLAGNKYKAQADNIFYRDSVMLFSALFDADAEHIELDDCTKNWNPEDCESIIASPILGTKVMNNQGEEERIDSWVLDHVIPSMNYKGRRMLALLSSNVLVGKGKYETLRHDLTESNLLDTIVLLPADILPTTGVSTAILLFKEGRSADAPITIADFSIVFQDRDDDNHEKRVIDIEEVKNLIDQWIPEYIVEVSKSQIQENDYSWHPSSYINKDEDIPSGYTKTHISCIFEQVDEFDAFPFMTTNVITHDCLCSDPFEQYKDHITDNWEKLQEKSFDEEDLDFINGSIFVMNLQEELQTYWLKDNSILHLCTTGVPNTCFVFRVNSDEYDINYLRLILQQIYEDVKALPIKERYVRLMKSEVVIPISIDEQRQLFEDAKMTHIIEKARKEGLNEAIDRMKQEYMMEVRMRKHDMKPFLSQLDSQAKLISFYLDKIDGNDQTVEAIRAKLLGVSNAVSELRLHLNRLTEEDIYGIPELVNPLDILKEFVGTFDNYEVSLDIDNAALMDAEIEEPQMYISPVDFSTLVGTIKENAVTHAFTDKDKKYHFRIFFSYDKKNDNYIIDFTNDGAPMPKGMDKFRYGLKGEKGARSKGTGLGGYRVKAITQHYGGDYNVFCKNTKETITTIRVEFPANDEKPE